MNAIEGNIERIRAEIGKAAAEAGRSPDEITLLAVSKGRTAREIRAAHAAGQRHFGENFVQEALAKIETLADLEAQWHFIGAIQSNKTRAISDHFQWVHTVDRIRIAERLARQLPSQRAPLNVCLQINLDAEPTKAGVAPEGATQLALRVAGLSRLRLRGLMAIPAPNRAFEDQCHAFARLKDLFDQLSRQLGAPDFDTLSMGMSDDFPAAIQEGATIVRIGTAIFGPRETAEVSAKRPV